MQLTLPAPSECMFPMLVWASAQLIANINLLPQWRRNVLPILYNVALSCSLLMTNRHLAALGRAHIGKLRWLWREVRRAI